jgi:WhiB family redox-sensing transcriptional regulator
MHEPGRPPTFAELLFARPPWQERALCRGQTELFFPERGASTEPAKAICDECPVRAECLDHALEGRDRHGIWGGLSERQRRKLRVPLDTHRRPHTIGHRSAPHSDTEPLAEIA